MASIPSENRARASKSFFRKKTYIFFLLPGLLLYSLFIIYPIISSVPYSFLKWNGIGEKVFVGFQNYVEIFLNPVFSNEFYNALKNCMYFIGLHFIIENPIMIFLAYLMYKKIRGYAAFRVIIFFPLFINAVATGFMITLMFDPNFGLYSIVMKAIGLGKWNIFPWAADPTYGIPYVTLIGAWKGIMYETMIYLSNFNMIPAEYEEAAVIDGAGEFKKLIHIYIPLLMPSFINVTVLMWVTGIAIFDIPYVIAGTFGGVDHCMDFLGLFLYRTAFISGSYTNNTVGMGASISIVMFLLIALGTSVLLAILRKRQIEME